jgi:xanthine/CO dehydrogenase XdhC/CoxF family maturation factor
VSDNPIARALFEAAVVGRRASLLFEAAALDDLRSGWLSAADAVVLCDHDTSDRDAILALLLDGEAGRVAMMGSKARTAATYAELDRPV